MSSSTDIPKVYSAIAAVMADLSKEGIAKDRNNDGQKFKFRGIDDVYNALAPLLSRHRLMMLPRVLSRTAEVRDTKNGGTMQYVVVDVEFDMVSAEDGSMHTIRTVGEAMDSGDKATNKAMSAAFKYAAFQALCIPTEGDHDADATTHQLAPKANATQEAGEYLKSLKMSGAERKSFADEFGAGWQEAALIARQKGIATVDGLLDLWASALNATEDAHLVTTGGVGS